MDDEAPRFVLRPTLQVREERFGALLYDRTDRKLLFLRSQSAMALLLALPATRDDAVAAGKAAADEATTVSRVEAEFEELLATGMIGREA